MVGSWRRTASPSSAGVRPNCSLNNGKNSRGKQLDDQAKSLTQRLVSKFWACHLVIIGYEGEVDQSSAGREYSMMPRRTDIESPRVGRLNREHTARPVSGETGSYTRLRTPNAMSPRPSRNAVEGSGTPVAMSEML